MPNKNSGGMCKEHKNIIADILKEQTSRDDRSDNALLMLQNTINRSYSRYEQNKVILNNDNVYFSDYFRLPENRNGMRLLQFNQLINETLQNNLLNRLKNRVLKPHLHEYLKEPELKLLFTNTSNIKYTFDIIKRNLISQDKIQDLNTFIQVISNIIENHKNTNLQREAIEEKIRKHNEHYSDNIALEHLKDEKYLLRFTCLSYPFVQQNTPSIYCSNNNFKAFDKNVGSTEPSFIYYDFSKQDNEKRYFGYINWNFKITIYNEENIEINKTEVFQHITNIILDNININSNFFIDSLKILYSPREKNVFYEEFFFLSELITVSYAIDIKKAVARLNSEYNRLLSNNDDGMKYLYSKMEYMDSFINDAKPETLKYIVNNLNIFKNMTFFRKFIDVLLDKKQVKDNSIYNTFFNLEYVINNYLIDTYLLPKFLEKEDFLVLFICKKDVVGEKLKNNLYFYLKDVYLKTSSTKEERLSAFNYVKRTLPHLVDDFIFELYTNNINTLSSYESIFYITNSSLEAQQKLLHTFTKTEKEELNSDVELISMIEDDNLDDFEFDTGEL